MEWRKLIDKRGVNQRMLQLLVSGSAGVDEEMRSESYYDVFISFCGDDTGRNFAGNLHNALRHKRIKTFFRLPETHHHLDWEVSLASIVKAIEESRILIVVLSKNYASSSRCLDELVKIIECMRMNNQAVWPVFYKVDPSVVRRQQGAYGEAMLKQGISHSEKSVERWRTALLEVTNLNGSHYRENEYEYKLIKRIVESVVQSLPRFDIFLSFSGEDTRYSFTGFLYHALRQEGFKTFMDDEELEGGNQISKTLLEAIGKSRLSIIVFSENYGYSTWCLDELSEIVESMKTKNQLVWPIFYRVEQSDVSNQTKSYGNAMIAHEHRFGKDSEKVQKWRSALSEMAFLEGYHIKEKEYEHEFVKKIVEKAIDIENHL